MESVIEPAKALANDGNPPIYRAFLCKEFLINFLANGDDTEKVLAPYKLQD